MQDIGLAFHPPFLYLGYVGLSMTFSFAVAALIEGKVDAAWGRWVRPWTLAAWLFLTIGIALGSLVGLLRAWLGRVLVLGPGRECVLHALAAGRGPAAFRDRRRKARGAEKLDDPAGNPRLRLSLLGTFIVRSGLLTSVHAFANDPERGTFILLILSVFVGGALTLFAARARVMEPLGVFVRSAARRRWS